MAIVKKVFKNQSFNLAFEKFADFGELLLYQHTPVANTYEDDVSEFMSLMQPKAKAEGEKEYYQYFVLVDRFTDFYEDTYMDVMDETSYFINVAQDISEYIYNTGHQNSFMVNQYMNLLVASYIVDPEREAGVNSNDEREKIENLIEEYIALKYENLRWYDFE